MNGTIIMKVVLINPAIEMNHRNWYSLGIGYIAAVLLKEGFEVEIVDIIGENLTKNDFINRIKNIKADCFGIGGIVTAFNNVVDAALYIREQHPQAFIFAGNTVAYSIPDIILKNSVIEAVVLGEGEITVCELMHAIKDKTNLSEVKGIMYKDKQGNVYTTGKREPIQDLDALPLPAWELMPLENYFRNTRSRYCIISTVRGCPYNCIYCCKTFIDYKVRYRSAESIIFELLEFYQRYNMDVIYFFDDLSTGNKKRIIDFCKLKINSKLAHIPWTLSARVNLFDDEIAQMLKKANCSQICFGIESLDQGILDSINKRVTLQQIEEAITICERNNMDFGGSSFMVGAFDETEETIKKASDFSRKHNLRYEPHFMTPFPGTKLYEYAREKGFIKDELKYVKKIALQGNTDYLILNLTKNLTDEQLQTLRDKYLFFPKSPKLSLAKILSRGWEILNLYGMKKFVESFLQWVKNRSNPASFDKNSNIWK